MLPITIQNVQLSPPARWDSVRKSSLMEVLSRSPVLVSTFFEHLQYINFDIIMGLLYGTFVAWNIFLKLGIYTYLPIFWDRYNASEVESKDL